MKALGGPFFAEGLEFNFDAHDVWHLRGVGKYNRIFNAIIALIAITRSGDSVIDIRTARASGCKSIAITSGMSSEKHLREEKPDYIFRNMWRMTKEFMRAQP